MWLIDEIERREVARTAHGSSRKCDRARLLLRPVTFLRPLAFLAAATAAAACPAQEANAPAELDTAAETPSAEWVPLGDGPWRIGTEELDVRVEVVTKDLERPWGMAFLPNGDMLVSERPGRLRVIRDGRLDPEPVGGLPAIRTAVFGGLMDLALHPDFESNRLVYWTYSKTHPDDDGLAATAVGRGRYDGGSTLEDVEDVFVAQPWYGPAMAEENDRCCGQPPPGAVYGSRIAFGEDGLLYATLGDRGWGELAQDPGTHFGKIVRINDDGTVPADNPFVRAAGYRPEIWTLGHRNPVGLTFDSRTGELWSTEFGPRGGDELNLIEPGRNYGWVYVTEGTHYNEEPPALGRHSVPGMTDAVLSWVPSINPGNIAFYHGAEFPSWQGDLLMGAHTRSLVRIRFDDDGRPIHEERMLGELAQRIRDVRVGPDGFVYMTTDEVEGAVLRVMPAPAR